MQTFIRGSDRGNVVLMALILIIVLSTLFISLAARINAINNFSRDYKARVMHTIEQENREIRERYDF